MEGERAESKLTFNGLLLLGIVLLSVVATVMGTALYVLPADTLQLPELQPFAQVGRESEFPVGASRLVNWGDAIILVVRRSETEYAGLGGVSPDGCILEWDDVSLRLVSPCTYMVYDLRGNVVEGLTTTPLRRYPVYVRAGIVYVTA